MARLMEQKGNAEKGGGRKASFKTKERKSSTYVANRVSVPSNSVAELASKFNAVLVEEGGRQLLRRLKPESGSSVRAAVLAFESKREQNGPAKVVVVRSPSSASIREESKPRIQPKPRMAEKERRPPLPVHSKPNKVYTPEVNFQLF